MNLDDQIKTLASLVSLVLLLITLFTNQRATKLHDLACSESTTKRDVSQQIALSGGVLIATALVFLSGLPLLWRTLHHLDVSNEPIRSVFTIVWLLLIGVQIWQCWLIYDGWCLRKKSA